MLVGGFVWDTMMFPWDDRDESKQPEVSGSQSEATAMQRVNQCTANTSIKGRSHTPLKSSFSFKRDVDLRRSKSNLIMAI